MGIILRRYPLDKGVIIRCQLASYFTQGIFNGKQASTIRMPNIRLQIVLLLRKPATQYGKNYRLRILQSVLWAATNRGRSTLISDTYLVFFYPSLKCIIWQIVSLDVSLHILSTRYSSDKTNSRTFDGLVTISLDFILWLSCGYPRHDFLRVGSAYTKFFTVGKPLACRFHIANSTKVQSTNPPRYRVRQYVSQVNHKYMYSMLVDIVAPLWSRPLVYMRINGKD